MSRLCSVYIITIFIIIIKDIYASNFVFLENA